MFKAVKKILGFITTIYDLIVNIVEGLLDFLEMLYTAIALPPIIAGFMPSVISAAVLSVVAIGVTKVIIGR